MMDSDRREGKVHSRTLRHALSCALVPDGALSSQKISSPSFTPFEVHTSSKLDFPAAFIFSLLLKFKRGDGEGGVGLGGGEDARESSDCSGCTWLIFVGIFGERQDDWTEQVPVQSVQQGAAGTNVVCPAGGSRWWPSV